MMYDVDPQKHIDALAAELAKAGITQPEWAAFVRTGVSKERVPARQDWWQVRAAAILMGLAIAASLLGALLLLQDDGQKG